MRTVTLFALLSTACALPTPEHEYFTRSELEIKAREVEAFITLLEQIKKIALAPFDDDDWKQPDSYARDMEAFLATIDLLKNMATTEQTIDNQGFVDILDHLRSWVLATGGQIELFDIPGYDKDAYLGVLSLIEDIENYIDSATGDREEFLIALDWLRRTVLTTGGEWDQLDVHDVDGTAFKALLDILKDIDDYGASYKDRK